MKTIFNNEWKFKEFDEELFIVSGLVTILRLSACDHPRDIHLVFEKDDTMLSVIMRSDRNLHGGHSFDIVKPKCHEWEVIKADLTNIQVAKFMLGLEDKYASVANVDSIAKYFGAGLDRYHIIRSLDACFDHPDLATDWIRNLGDQYPDSRKRMSLLSVKAARRSLYTKRGLELDFTHCALCGDREAVFYQRAIQAQALSREQVQVKHNLSRKHIATGSKGDIFCSLCDEKFDPSNYRLS